MKIIILSSLSIESGSAIRNWGICRALVKLGHKVSYVEPAKKKWIRNVPDNMEYYRINIWCSTPLWIIPAFFKYFKYLFGRDYDVVMVMKALPHTCIPAAIWKCLLKKKAIVDYDDVEWSYHKSNVLKIVEKFVFKVFDFFNVHNEELKNYLIKNNVAADKIFFLGQGVDVDMIKEKTGKADRVMAGDPVGDIVLVYAAHLGVASSLPSILSVFKRLIEKTSSIRLLIIGGGFQLDLFKSLVLKEGLEDKVVFTGYLSHEAAISQMKNCNIALNYLEEAYQQRYRAQIKIREYLALGLPVVSNCGGDIERFKDYIEIVNNDEQFVARVLSIIGNYRAAKEKALRGKTFIEERYDWLKLVEEWIENLTRI